MTISRETYECERKKALRIIATTRRVEGKWRVGDLPEPPPVIDDINSGLRDHMRRSLVDLRYAYYVGMPQDGNDG